MCGTELKTKEQNYCQFCGFKLSGKINPQQSSTPTSHNPSKSSSNRTPSFSNEPIIAEPLFPTSTYQTSTISGYESGSGTKCQLYAKKFLAFAILSNFLGLIALYSGMFLAMSNSRNISNYDYYGYYNFDPLTGTSLLIIPIILSIVSFILGVLAKIYNRRSAKLGYAGKKFRSAGSVLAVFGIIFGVVGIIAGGISLFFLVNMATTAPPDVAVLG